MTTKDAATIREVYNLVNEMRQEMRDMKRDIKDEFQATMQQHCDWSKEIVNHYDGISKDFEKRINKSESFIDNFTGKIAIISALIGFACTIFFNLVTDALAKGK